MSYGASGRGTGQQIAAYVDKILHGARPADLPVEQPMKFDLVINLKTAQGSRAHDYPRWSSSKRTR